MNLIDGFVRARAVVSDSSAAKSGGVDGSVSNDGQGAAFGDILSDVSKRDGKTDMFSALPNPPPSAPISVREMASVKIVAVAAEGRRFGASAKDSADMNQMDSAMLYSAASADAVQPSESDAPSSAGVSGQAPANPVERVGDASSNIVQIPESSVIARSDAAKTHAGGMAGRVAIGAVETAGATSIDPQPTVRDSGRPRVGTPELNPNQAAANSAGDVEANSVLDVADRNVGGDQNIAVIVTGAATRASQPSAATATGEPPTESFLPIQDHAGRRDAGKAHLEPATPLRVGSSDLKDDPAPARKPAANNLNAAGLVAAGDRPAPFAAPVERMPAPQPDASIGLNIGASSPLTPSIAAALPGPRIPSGMGRISATAELQRQSAASRPTSSGSARIDAALAQSSSPSTSAERGQIKVAVLDRQTHLPPSAQHSAVHQIADRTVAEAELAFASVAERGDATAPPGAERPAGPDATPAQSLPLVLKAVNLQLEPESLGAVTIRMRLSGIRLEVQVEADRPDTMRIISDDKDHLADRLRSAGYATDNIVVRMAEQQTAQMQHGQGHGQPNASESQANVAAGSSRHSQDGGSSADDPSRAQKDRPRLPSLATGSPEDRSSGGGNGAVYL